MNYFLFSLSLTVASFSPLDSWLLLNYKSTAQSETECKYSALLVVWKRNIIEQAWTTKHPWQSHVSILLPKTLLCIRSRNKYLEKKLKCWSIVASCNVKPKLFQSTTEIKGFRLTNTFVGDCSNYGMQSYMKCLTVKSIRSECTL